MTSQWIRPHCQLPQLSCMIFDNCDSIDYPLVRTARTAPPAPYLVTMTNFLQLQNKGISKTPKNPIYLLFCFQSEFNMTAIAVFNTSLTQLGLNCTWCQLWQGDECYQVIQQLRGSKFYPILTFESPQVDKNGHFKYYLPFVNFRLTRHATQRAKIAKKVYKPPLKSLHRVACFFWRLLEWWVPGWKRENM